MEKRGRTQEQWRKEKFDRIAANARELGDRALREVDAVLREEEEIRANLEAGVQAGTIGPDEVVTNLRAWKIARTRSIDPQPPDIVA